MKNLLIAAMLYAVPAAAAPAPRPCTAVELEAGTVLEDGSIAGEWQALDYLKEKDPALRAEVGKLAPAALRGRFAQQLYWFQQVGNFRTRQKEESLRQLKADLMSDALAAQAEKAAPADLAALEKRLRAALSERFDSDLYLLDHEAASMEQALEQYARESKDIRRKIVERKKNREAIIEKRLREVLRKS